MVDLDDPHSSKEFLNPNFNVRDRLRTKIRGYIPPLEVLVRSRRQARARLPPKIGEIALNIVHFRLSIKGNINFDLSK